MLAMADSNGQYSVFLLSHGNKRGIESVNSREKIPPGSDSPRRPTRSDLRKFIASAVGRLRNSPGRIFQRLGTQTDSRKHCSVEPLKWATRVVFRHFLPISSSRACENRGGLRNSPGRIFQLLGTHIDLRVRRRDHVLREFASRAGVCVGEAQHV